MDRKKVKELSDKLEEKQGDIIKINNEIDELGKKVYCDGE